jgi:hypothetical protein
MKAVNLPRSRYLQVSHGAPAVKGGAATERSEAPLTGGGSAVARLPIGSGRPPLSRVENKGRQYYRRDYGNKM